MLLNSIQIQANFTAFEQQTSTEVVDGESLHVFILIKIVRN